MRTRTTRVIRGLFAASIATFFAAFSHGVAGAEAPGFFSLSVAFTASVFICTALAGRTASTWRLAIAVGLSQVAYHTLFSFVPASGALQVSDAGALAGEGAHVHSQTMIHLDAVVTQHAHSSDALMWVSHIAAACVTLGALRYGEHVALGLFQSLRLAVLALFGAIVAVAPQQLIVPLMHDRRGVQAFPAVLLSTMRRRGPPAGRCRVRGFAVLPLPRVSALHARGILA
ncbi:hypothetical protein GCM10027416_00100 [Okibacterium endophyticum]